MSQSSRRKFLQQTALAATGFFIVPRHVLGRGYIPPSDTLRIAGIGVGGKGESDLLEFSKSKHVSIVSLCDVDDKMAANSVKRFPKASYYNDFRVMLAKEKNNIDAVCVSTPDHTHAVAALAAMQLGKHVYVQKPLAHSIEEARKLTEAAAHYKVVTQMGNQGASGDGVRTMMEWYQQGLIGEVQKVYAWTNRPVWPQGIPTPYGKYDIPTHLQWDLWLGPAAYTDYNPAYHPFNWRGWWKFGTGALGDMACHILDPVFRLLPINHPYEVACSVPATYTRMWSETVYGDSCPAASVIHLKYRNQQTQAPISLTWMDGGLLPERPEELLPDEPMGNGDGGVLFIGTKGKMMAGCYASNPTLLPTARSKEHLPQGTIPKVPEGHYLQWVNACMNGYSKGVTSSPFSYAGPFVESILIGNLALRSWQLEQQSNPRFPGRRSLLWDAQNLRITNFDEANQFVRNNYRAGWALSS
ncbi:MAG TPA: oxidoreductase [Chitinophagaceae bacterium]|nr:oxidoreductase [Chitinophagaceae bacterium]